MDPLATPADVRTFLNLNAGQDEALLTTLCGAASEFVLQYVNRTFEVVQHTEKYDGTGTRTLVPESRPIVDVLSVSISGKSIPKSNSYAENGFTFDRFGLQLRGYVFDREIRNVDITYTSGYATVPADVKQAVVEIVAEKYQRRLRLGVSSKSIGQESISYSQNDLTPNAKMVLNQYKVRYYG